MRNIYLNPDSRRGRKASSFVKHLFHSLLCFVFLSLFLSSCLYGKTALKVGVYNNKPTIFVSETGVVQGLFIDILDDIAARENWDIEYVVGHFSELHDCLRAGTIDILPAIAYSREREKFVDFTSETVIANWGEVYTSANVSITSLMELDGKRIAAKQGDIHLRALKKMVGDFNISCRFVEADEYETVFEMLNANYVDIGVVNRLYGNEKKAEYQVQDTPIIFNPIEMRFAAPERKNEAVVNKLDVYLAAAKKDQNSFYYDAVSRWLVINTKKRVPGWFWQLLAAGVGSALFFFIATLLFRAKVKQRTAELSKTNEQLNLQIEERKRTEVALRKFVRMVEASSDAMALVDKEHRHILVNTVYRETVAASVDDLENMSLPDLLGEDFFNKELKESVLSCLQGRVVNVQTMPRKDPGSTSYWGITLSPYYQDNNEIDGYVIDIRDMTGQVEMQHRLENAQKMEAIGLLAGGVAHDLNNILSGIVSYPDMLLVGRKSDDPMTKPLRTIKQSGERAAAIVLDLLTLARRGVGAEEVINLNDIINAFVGSPEHDDILMHVPAIKVELQLGSDLLNIRGSAVHLSKILMNLFCNAVEAMQASGRLTIATENCFFEQDYGGYEVIPAGEYAVLSVADTGIGMSPAEIKRIFEPFYTNKIMGRSGTGLGMSVVWGSIKDHRGFIDVRSEAGKGATFFIELPAYVESEALP